MGFSKNKLIGVFVIFIIVGIIVKSGIISNTQETVTATVSKTERVTYGSGETIEHIYLVYTDKETFKCTDELFVGKFNSSDIYGSLKEGHRYKFEVYGFRIGYTSSYRNIISAQEIPLDTNQVK